MSRGLAETLVSIVTHNDAPDLERCLEAVRNQSVPVRVRVFDNASRDESVAIAARFGVDVESSPDNLGFSVGHNRNIAGQSYRNVLFLNPDCYLEPDCVERLIEAIREVPGAGFAGGKIFRMDPQGDRVRSGKGWLLDSAGMYITPAQRHFDRGSQQVDLGQFDRRELVFGITGACLLCSNEFVSDLVFEDEFFDADFFAYREDADLAWRAQIQGWKAVYEPRAVARHKRLVLPERRREISAILNYHSLKNRYLMRRKNMGTSVWWRCFPHAWLRDLGIVAYVLLIERTSIGAFSEARQLRDRMAAKRAATESRRRVPDRGVAAWFSFKPVSRYPG